MSKPRTGEKVMAKWDVYGTVHASKYLGQVEAETAEEAINKAWKMDECFVSLCHQCSRHAEDPEITQVEVERVEE